MAESKKSSNACRRVSACARACTCECAWAWLCAYARSRSGSPARRFARTHPQSCACALVPVCACVSERPFACARSSESNCVHGHAHTPALTPTHLHTYIPTVTR
eukprot:3258396-Pleurochrysis_carterae.AAC.1